MKSKRELHTAAVEKVHDYIHTYCCKHLSVGRCRIRIYERPGGVPVVIASELVEDVNTSVTNFAEYLAAEIIAKHFPHRFEEEIPVVWIEHYPALAVQCQRGDCGHYSFVEFDSYKPRREDWFGLPRVRIGDPAWLPLREDEVKQIVGEKPS
jgi:hypothetical protein